MLTQVHTDRMIRDGTYEHKLLTAVDRLWLGPDGVVGCRGDESILHAHHRSHPNKLRADNPRKFLPARLLSFGFTSHYALMAERFGAASVGCAGEDIVVEYADQASLDQVSRGVQIRRGDRAIDLVDAAVAKPCVPFTKFLLGDQQASDETVAPNRAFLDNGIRGFIVGLANQGEPVDIAPGDEFWVRA